MSKGPPMPNLPRVLLRAPLRVMAWTLLLLVGLATPGLVTAMRRKKTTPARRMVSAFLCELKTCTLGSRSAWASGHFSAQTARRDSSARCRGDAYG
jgi:hypothetical protein